MSAQPHDAYVKATFSKVRNARGELRAALPPSVRALVDWRTLKVETGSFVDATLRSRFTDLLFSARIAGRDARIYMLFEHQSTHDPLLVFRVLAYEVRVWEAWLARHPRAKRLPPIVPVVLAQVRGKWRASKLFIELIQFADAAEREALTPFMPRLEVRVDDLALLGDEQLRARAMSAGAKLALASLREMRRRRAPDAIERRLGPWVGSIPATREGTDDLRAFAQYIWAARPEMTKARLGRLVARGAPRGEDVVMTTARQLLAKGKAEGKAEGRREALAEMLIKLLTRRFGKVPERMREKIIAADARTLARWGERVLTAPSLAAVLDD